MTFAVLGAENHTGESEVKKVSVMCAPIRHWFRELPAVHDSSCVETDCSLLQLPDFRTCPDIIRHDYQNYDAKNSKYHGNWLVDQALVPATIISFCCHVHACIWRHSKRPYGHTSWAVWVPKSPTQITSHYLSSNNANLFIPLPFLLLWVAFGTNFVKFLEDILAI